MRIGTNDIGETLKVAFGAVAVVIVLLFGIYFYGRGVGREIGQREGRAIGERIGYERGFKEGKQEGQREGGKTGYLQGYQDARFGRQNTAEKEEWDGLARGRHETKATFVLAAAILSIAFLLYWLPFVYLRNTTLIRGLRAPATSEEPSLSWYSLRETFDANFRDGLARRAFISKALLSLALLVGAGVFLHGDLLARLSQLYVNAIPFEVLGEVAVVLTGAAVIAALIWLLEISTVPADNPDQIFGWKLFWAGIIPLLLYQLMGSVASAYSVDAASTIKMLELQAGMLVGMTIYLSVKLSLAVFRKLRSQRVTSEFLAG